MVRTHLSAFCGLMDSNAAMLTPFPLKIPVSIAEGGRILRLDIGYISNSTPISITCVLGILK
jgi:hypothetical protein